jgi:hypothetical protein
MLARASSSNYVNTDQPPEGAAYQSYEGFVPPRTHHRAYQGGGLPSQQPQGPSELGGQEFSSVRFHAASSNFVPARHSFAGFDHERTTPFNQGVQNNMRTQMNTQDLHTNLMYQQQGWMN